MKYRAAIATAMTALTVTAIGAGGTALSAAGETTPRAETRTGATTGDTQSTKDTDDATKGAGSAKAAESADNSETIAEPGSHAALGEQTAPSAEMQMLQEPQEALLFDAPPMVISAQPFAGMEVGSSESVIGTIDTDQLAPEGIDFAGMPPVNGGSASVALPGPTALTGGYGCMISCIEEGLAYARGFGAELVVQTSVPTTMFFGVIELSPGYPPVDTNMLYSMDTYHSWELDGLEPGHSYGVTVVATDGDGNSDLGYGEFTTLSTRSVAIEIGDVTITGGPSVIEETQLSLKVDDFDRFHFGAGQGDPPFFGDVDGSIDVELAVRRFFNTGEACDAVGGIDEYDYADQGHSIGQCMVWNTARIDDLDLDVVPEGATRWNSTNFTRNLSTPSGAGEALPAGFGDDWWLDIQTTATFHVTYS